MTILVTGVTGKTGRRVVESLVSRGVGVRALVRDLERGKLATLGMTVELIQGDFNKPETIADAAKGCEGMFLVSTDSERQVSQEITSAKVAIEAGIQHIVKLSSSDAGQRPYAWSVAHAEIEESIAEMDVGFSFLRPHYFMQNYFSLLKAAANGQITLEAPASDGTIGAIDAHDIGECAAVLLASGKPLGTHALLTGPENVSMDRVARAFANAVGRQITFVDLEPAEYRAQLESEDAESAGDIADVFSEVRVGTMAVQTNEVELITGNAARSIEQFALANVESINRAIAAASSAHTTT